MFNNIRRYFSEEEKETRRVNKLKEETKRRKVAEGVMKDLSNEYDEIKEKYIQLLEDKSDKFDKLIEYQELCKTQEFQIKEYKKEISDLKSENKEYETQLEQTEIEKEEVEKELKKIQKKYNIQPKKSILEKEIEKVVEKNG